MGRKESLIKPLSSDWNPPNLCILSSACKSEQRQNSRPENEFKRTLMDRFNGVFNGVLMLLSSRAFASSQYSFLFLNKFSNISGMYFKNTQHTYEKAARETIHERNWSIGPLLSITYFNTAVLSILKKIKDKIKNLGRGLKKKKLHIWKRIK